MPSTSLEVAALCLASVAVDCQPIQMEVNELAVALNSCLHLKSLTISNCKLSSANFIGLAVGLRSCCRLELLDVSGSSANRYRLHVPSLHIFFNTYALNITVNDLTADAWRALLAISSSLPKLQVLNMSGRSRTLLATRQSCKSGTHAA
jgi:hypothetical protein